MRQNLGERNFGVTKLLCNFNEKGPTADVVSLSIPTLACGGGGWNLGPRSGVMPNFSLVANQTAGNDDRRVGFLFRVVFCFFCLHSTSRKFFLDEVDRIRELIGFTGEQKMIASKLSLLRDTDLDVSPRSSELSLAIWPQREPRRLFLLLRESVSERECV